MVDIIFMISRFIWAPSDVDDVTDLVSLQYVGGGGVGISRVIGLCVYKPHQSPATSYSLCPPTALTGRMGLYSNLFAGGEFFGWFTILSQFRGKFCL